MIISTRCSRWVFTARGRGSFLSRFGSLSKVCMYPHISRRLRGPAAPPLVILPFFIKIRHFIHAHYHLSAVWTHAGQELTVRSHLFSVNSFQMNVLLDGSVWFWGHWWFLCWFSFSAAEQEETDGERRDNADSSEQKVGRNCSKQIPLIPL